MESPTKTCHMEHTQLSHPGCSVYPGEYVPLFNEEEVKEELKHTQDGDASLPPVNVNELPDSYTVEVAIPGVKREELYIHADKNMLSVSVIQLAPKTDLHKKIHLHEFDHQCFDRDIILPEDVDPSFALAEYSGGLLCMHVPKAKQPGRDIHTRIIVY